MTLISGLCTGNTPLVRINSLSDLTGVEILVSTDMIAYFTLNACPLTPISASGQVRIFEPVRLSQGPSIAAQYVYLGISLEASLTSDTDWTVIKQAEEQGLIHPHTGSCVFEGTSGSTGISIAGIARARGYKAREYIGEEW